MSPTTESIRDYLGGFPRVSGDEPRIVRPLVGLLMFSPRERG